MMIASYEFRHFHLENCHPSHRSILSFHLNLKKTAVTIEIYLIARKYEEICAPQVEEFCYITDNTYFKEEVYTQITIFYSIG